MRIIFLNAGYCTGIKGRKLEYLAKFWKYIYSGRKNLKRLKSFLVEAKPDIVALAELDSGSVRSFFLNQAEFLGKGLGLHLQTCRPKYGARRIENVLPIFRNHCNAILAKEEVVGFNTYYLRTGIKRLILQAQIAPDIDFFVVHLSLGKRGRTRQLQQLSRMIKKSRKVIITGDFNVFDGHGELKEFLKKHRLVSANRLNLPTFPSWRPVAELDYFLLSANIKIKKFRVMDELLSDHLPIMLEI